MDYDPDQDPDETAQDGHGYVSGDDEMMGLVEHYLNRIDGNMSRGMLYREAERLIDPDVDAEELSRCVEVYADHPAAPETGYLFAAADAVTGEQYHVFDHPELADVGLRGVGYGLDADETLVIRTPVEEAGWYAEGTIAHTAAMDGATDGKNCVLGFSAEGAVINTGETDKLGPVEDGAVVRNRGQLGSLNLPTGRALNEGTVTELHQGTSTVVNRGSIGEVVAKPGYGEDGLIINDGQIGELRSRHGMLVNHSDDSQLRPDRGIHLNYGEDIVPEQDGGHRAQLFDAVNSHDDHQGWALIADQDRIGQWPELESYLEELGAKLDPQRPFEDVMADIQHEEPRSEDRIRDQITLMVGTEPGPDDQPMEDDTDGV